MSSFVCRVLGIVICSAGALKLYSELNPSAVSNPSIGASTILFANIELATGIYLASGILPNIAWRMALGVFSLFAIVSFEKVLSGSSTCNCFGALGINPLVTFLFDGAAVATLVCLGSPTNMHNDSNNRTLCIGRILARFVVVGLGCCLLLLTVIHSGSQQSDTDETDDAVKLLPEAWIGKRWPLLADIDISDQLAAGTWTVTVLNRNCPHCQKFLRGLESRVNNAAFPGALAIVEIGQGSSIPLNVNVPHVFGRVRSAFNWSGDLPFAITIQDGIVVSVYSTA